MPQDNIAKIVEQVGAQTAGKLKALKLSTPDEVKATVLAYVQEAMGANPAELQAIITKAVLAQVPAGGAFNPGGPDGRGYDPELGLKSLGKERLEQIKKQVLFAVASPALKSEMFAGASAKDLEVQVGANGGYLVPTEFIGEVLRKLVKISTFRGNARVFSGVGLTGSIPRETGTVTISYKPEGVSIGSTQPTIGALIWALAKRTALTTITRELFEFSAIDVITLLSTMIAEQMQLMDDNVYMNGDGSGEPMGIRNLTTGMGSAAQQGEALDWTDLVAIKHAVPSQYRKEGGLWIMNNETIQIVANLKDDQNRPLFIDRGPAGLAGPNVPPQTVGFILGYPVMEDNYIPSDLGDADDESEIWFGNLQRGYAIFDKGSMETKTSEESGDNFAQNKMSLRAITYDDGKPAIPEALAVLSGVK